MVDLQGREGECRFRPDPEVARRQCCPERTEVQSARRDEGGIPADAPEIVKKMPVDGCLRLGESMAARMG